MSTRSANKGLFLIGGTAADQLGAPGHHRRLPCGRWASEVFAFRYKRPAASVLASVLSGTGGALFNPAGALLHRGRRTGPPRRSLRGIQCLRPGRSTVQSSVSSTLVAVDFHTTAVAAAVVFAALTVAQMRFPPAHPVERAETTVLRGWGAVLAFMRFVLFTLAMLGMFAAGQMYLVYPVVAGRITDWGGAVAVLF